MYLERTYMACSSDEDIGRIYCLKARRVSIGCGLATERIVCSDSQFVDKKLRSIESLLIKLHVAIATEKIHFKKFFPGW